MPKRTGIKNNRIEAQGMIWMYEQMNNAFVVWEHGTQKLNNFLNHINSIHPSIKFNIEVEAEDKIAFLYDLVTRKADRLGHTVYSKLQIFI